MADEPLFVARSVTGRDIRLTATIWRKIQRDHLEFRDQLEYIQEIEKAIGDPDHVVPGRRGALIALRWSEGAPSRPKHVAVVYPELDEDGFVITAFFLSRHERMLARGALWQRES